MILESAKERSGDEGDAITGIEVLGAVRDDKKPFARKVHDPILIIGEIQNRRTSGGCCIGNE